MVIFSQNQTYLGLSPGQKFHYSEHSHWLILFNNLQPTVRSSDRKNLMFNLNRSLETIESKAIIDCLKMPIVGPKTVQPKHSIKA